MKRRRVEGIPVLGNPSPPLSFDICWRVPTRPPTSRRKFIEKGEGCGKRQLGDIWEDVAADNVKEADAVTGVSKRQDNYN